MIDLGDQLASELAGLIKGVPAGLADRHSARDVVGPVLDARRFRPFGPTASAKFPRRVSQ